MDDDNFDICFCTSFETDAYFRQPVFSVIVFLSATDKKFEIPINLNYSLLSCVLIHIVIYIDHLFSTIIIYSEKLSC